MKYKEKDITDDEIRIIGGEEGNKGKRKAIRIALIVFGFIAVGALVCWLFVSQQQATKPYEQQVEQGYFDPEEPVVEQPSIKTPLSRFETTDHAFIEMADTVINDIPMRLYLPHQMQMTLHLGTINRKDPNILFATQAADVRADNGGIVGAFVLKGEPKAWGLSKRGYCAIINDTVTVGVADNSPLFEEATEKGGYFFRQFPLVNNGQIAENEQKGKSVRRALCDRNGEIFTVETLSAESFHDFSQALVDLGVDNAIYLIGSSAYGWATDADGIRHEFGDPNPPKKRWKNISYLVMRAMP